MYWIDYLMLWTSKKCICVIDMKYNALFVSNDKNFEIFSYIYFLLKYKV